MEEKPHMPKPEEHESMPQHMQCSLAKHREDRNPKCHVEQLKDVALIMVAHPPKPANGNTNIFTNEMLNKDMIVITQ
jgi:hypothetical protein